MLPRQRRTHRLAEQTQADIRFGEVKDGIRCVGDEWLVPYHPHGKQAPVILRATGLVITGPGTPRVLPRRQAIHPNISNSVSFWLPEVIQSIKEVNDGKIAVVGSGDTAASAVVTLLDNLPNPRNVEIHLFTKTGFTYSRSYGVGEVRRSTDPTNWHTLPQKARNEFIKRTERAVFSDVLKSRIDSARNVVTRAGLVHDADMKGKSVRLTLNKYNEGVERLSDRYKRVVIATGFKRCHFQNWFDEGQFRKPVEGTASERYDNEHEFITSQLIQHDLSYQYNNWPKPKLYLPMLAGLNCGPGFSSLGCLGRMSDRIIKSQLDLPI